MTRGPSLARRAGAASVLLALALVPARGFA